MKKIVNLITVIMSVVFLLASQQMSGQEKDKFTTLRVSLGEEFVLHSGQSAEIKKVGLKIRVFIKSCG